jgi:hypothetical protein
MVADVATQLGRAVGYLTGAGVIPPIDAPLPPPGSAEVTDSLAALLAGHTVAAPGLGDPGLTDSDLPLLDVDALVG